MSLQTDDDDQTGVLQLMAKGMFGNVKLYFLQQKIEITDFLSAGDTSVRIILASSVYRDNRNAVCVFISTALPREQTRFIVTWD